MCKPQKTFPHMLAERGGPLRSPEGGAGVVRGSPPGARAQFPVMMKLPHQPAPTSREAHTLGLVRAPGLRDPGHSRQTNAPTHHGASLCLLLTIRACLG